MFIYTFRKHSIIDKINTCFFNLLFTFCSSFAHKILKLEKIDYAPLTVRSVPKLAFPENKVLVDNK